MSLPHRAYFRVGYFAQPPLHEDVYPSATGRNSADGSTLGRGIADRFLCFLDVDRLHFDMPPIDVSPQLLFYSSFSGEVDSVAFFWAASFSATSMVDLRPSCFPLLYS